VRGREAILQRWQDTVSDATIRLASLRCILLRGGHSAVITLVELRSPNHEDALSATNIFEKGPDGCWRLSLHEARPDERHQLDSLCGDEEEEFFDEDVPGATG